MEKIRNSLERSLIEELKPRLEHKFRNIWIHKKPSASGKFKRYVERELGFLPILQPEFDMVFETNDGKLNAIEVKYLKQTEAGINIPFYLGIGQTLASKRFGFDHVGLWLFVDPSVPNEDLNKYGASTWHFVRNELMLDIEYTYVKIENKNGRQKFIVMQYKDAKSGYELNELDSAAFQITWKHTNRQRFGVNEKKTRKGIELFLTGKL